MNGKERTGRSTADDGNAVVVLEAPPLRRCAAHGLSPFGKDVRSVPAADRRPLRDKHSILVEGNYTTGKPLNCGKRTRGWPSSAAAPLFRILAPSLRPRKTWSKAGPGSPPPPAPARRPPPPPGPPGGHAPPPQPNPGASKTAPGPPPPPPPAPKKSREAPPSGPRSPLRGPPGGKEGGGAPTHPHPAPAAICDARLRATITR